MLKFGNGEYTHERRYMFIPPLVREELASLVAFTYFNIYIVQRLRNQDPLSRQNGGYIPVVQ